MLGQQEWGKHQIERRKWKERKVEKHRVVEEEVRTVDTTQCNRTKNEQGQQQQTEYTSLTTIIYEHLTTYGQWLRAQTVMNGSSLPLTVTVCQKQCDE